MSAHHLDRSLIPSILALLVAGLLFETTGIDLWFQDMWFDIHSHSWWIGTKAFWPRIIFYKGCKIVAWAVGLSALALALHPGLARVFAKRMKTRRVDLLVLATTLAAAPLLVATFKATTNVLTPAQIRRYGGFAPYVRPFERCPENDRPPQRGRAFPAGHASGGFALMALAGLAGSTRRRVIGLLTGVSFGTAMGFYQIANGNHYLSHTVYTGLLCWIVFLLARRCWGAAGAFAEEPHSANGNSSGSAKSQ